MRKAGEAVRSFDDAYTTKINKMYEGQPSPVAAIAALIGGGHPTFRKGQTDSEVMNYALPAVNAVPKYVLPAVGVGLAGQAVVDLASNQQSSGTLGL